MWRYLRNKKELEDNIKIYDEERVVMGRAIAQAVSRWLPTAATRIQTRV
jgi:hypothetical protein